MKKNTILSFILIWTTLTACTTIAGHTPYQKLRGDYQQFDPAASYQITEQTVPEVLPETKQVTGEISAEEKRLDKIRMVWAETINKTRRFTLFFDLERSESRKIQALAETDAIQMRLEKEIDLNLLISIALAQNPKLEKAKKDWEATLERYTQATRLDNVLRQYQSFIDDLNLQSTQMKHKAPIMKHFPLPGTLSLKGDIIDKEAKLARERYNIVLRDLITGIRVTYDALQYNIEQTKLTEENLAILRQLEETAFVKYETSKANFSDVIKVQVRIAQLADDLLTLKDFRETRVAKLAQFLKLDPSWQLGPPRPAPLRDTPLSIQSLIAMGRKHQQEIRIANLKIEKTNLAILLAEKRFYPDFTLGYSTLEAGKPEIPARLKKVATPFWFGKNDAYVREARLKYQGLLEKRQATEDKLVYTVKDLVFQFNTAKRDVHLYRTSLLPLAQEAFEVAETEYLAGKVSFLDLLDAETTWLKYKLLYHKSIKNQNQSIARLEQTIGRRLP